MPIKYRKNNTTYSLAEFDSSNHAKEIGVPIVTHIVGSIRFEIKGAGSYNDSDGTFQSPGGYVKISQGDTVKYNSYGSGRGLTLFVFSPDLVEQEKIRYDTYANGNSELISKLTTINKNYIYVLLSQDANTMDNDLKNLLNSQFGSNITTTYTRTRKGFALLYAGGQCAFQFASGVSNKDTGSTTLVRYLRSTNYVLSNMQTTEQSNNYNFSIGNVTYDTSKTYYVRVRYRTRGDGNGTASKCSSVGFITWNANWRNSYGYTHYSNTAYNERGRVIDWTYSFRPSSEFISGSPVGSHLFFIINNAWAYGHDNQTIDLYYYKFWSVDSSGNTSVISEKGVGGINVGRYGNISYRYNDAVNGYFLGFKKNNKIYYTPLISTMIDNSYGSQNEKDCETTGSSISNVKYNINTSYYYKTYINGTKYMGVSSITKTYTSNNKTYTPPPVNYNIPGGTYSPSQFQNLISRYISANGYRKTSNSFTATVNGQSQTFDSGVNIFYRRGYTATTSDFNAGKSWNFVNFGTNVTEYALDLARRFTVTYCTSTPGSVNTIMEWWKDAHNYDITISPGISFQ